MCRDLAKIASDYLEGKLGIRQNLAVKLHLMMCHGCTTFIHNLKTSTEMMKRYSSADMDEDLLRQIDERVEKALTAYKSNQGDGC
jgi:hypothetical protein